MLRAVSAKTTRHLVSSRTSGASFPTFRCSPSATTEAAGTVMVRWGCSGLRLSVCAQNLLYILMQAMRRNALLYCLLSLGCGRCCVKIMDRLNYGMRPDGQSSIVYAPLPLLWTRGGGYRRRKYLNHRTVRCATLVSILYMVQHWRCPVQLLRLYNGNTVLSTVLQQLYCSITVPLGCSTRTVRYNFYSSDYSHWFTPCPLKWAPTFHS